MAARRERQRQCFLLEPGAEFPRVSPRLGEALAMEWEMVDLTAQLLHVKREKRGIMPWVPILSEMKALLEDMRKRATSYLLFPSPFEPETPRDASAIRHRLNAACKALDLGHVTPHGLWSYFVTRARESGLTDAEIAMLIGDKTGPAIIAQTYGDVRPEHLLKQAQRIRLTASNPLQASGTASSIKSSNTSPAVSENVTATPGAAKLAEVTTDVEDERDLAQPSDTARDTPASPTDQKVQGSTPCGCAIQNQVTSR